MSSRNLILFILFFISICTGAQDKFCFSGQFSSWLNTSTRGDLPPHGGVRYIPRLNLEMPVTETRLFDAEISANTFGSADMHPFDTISSAFDLKPYRLWIRYSSDQLEI
jgi:hypothetical protein